MIRILIVDDEANIRNGYKRFFPWEELGYEVIGSVENGKTALDFLKNQDVDVIMTDIVMPVMDGLELARNVMREYPKVKIILLSNHENFEFARKAIESNVCSYVLKSDKHSVLIDTLSAIKDELTKEPLPETQGHSCSTIAAIQRYVRNNLDTANLNDAAKAVHLNQNYVSRLFKERTGQNFYDYVLELRIAYAKELLKQQETSIAQVSDALGYSDPKNFNRIFKKLEGVSPSEYQSALLL